MTPRELVAAGLRVEQVFIRLRFPEAQKTFIDRCYKVIPQWADHVDELIGTDESQAGPTTADLNAIEYALFDAAGQLRHP